MTPPLPTAAGAAGDPARPDDLRRKVPRREATVTGTVGREVQVRWDGWGIAHVFAATPADLAFGLGYATAQECLWRLDYCRRQARGQLAAVLGRGVLASDDLMHRLGLGRHADAQAAALPERLAEVLHALAAGINRWIEQAVAEARLPVEFDWLGDAPRPWTPADTIAIWKHRWWTLTGRLENLALGEAAQRHLPPELHLAFMAAELGEETIVPGSPAPIQPGRGGSGRPVPGEPVPGGADNGEGSNNWAVAGSRSVTGYPVLCSDPHNPFGQPGQWFQAQLTLADGTLDVAGAVYAGTPGVYFGRNRGLAWGFTNHVASVRDLYVERVDAGHPGLYFEDGQWRPFEVEQVAIAVQGEPDVRLDVRRTVRGPLVDDLLPALDPAPAGGGAPVSLRWAGLEVDTGLDALLALNAAPTVAAGLAALAGWVCPVANALLADTTGHIAYHAVGRVPRRRTAVRAYRDAADPDGTWHGFIPFDSLPHRNDPPEGWLASANQPPWPADPPGLSYLAGAAWADGWRMRRIKERLTAAPRLSPQEAGAAQGDVRGGRAAELAPPVVRLLDQSRIAGAREVARRLHGWDGQFTLPDVAPTVWTAFWEHWLRRVAAARFPPHLVALVAPQAGAVARGLLLGQETSPPWLGAADLAAEVEDTAGETFDWLRQRLGEAEVGWAWGRVHTVTWRHPLSQHGPAARRATAAALLDVGPFGTTGSSGTVRAAGYSLADPFRVVSGASFRMVADLSPRGGLRTTTTTGQSGHPGSPHYADQTRLWLDDAYLDFPLDGFEPAGVTRIIPPPPASPR